MRTLAVIFVLVLAVSCNKNKSVAKRVGGEWMMVRLIKDDGSDYTKNVRYRFDKGATDGKTFTNWNSFDYNDSIENSGTYCITDKGLEMVIKTNTQWGPVTDSAKVEDIDKKSMVIRTSQGISYFRKVEEE